MKRDDEALNMKESVRAFRLVLCQRWDVLLPPRSAALLPRVLGRHLSGSTALLSERTIDEQNLDALGCVNCSQKQHSDQ